MKFDDTFVSREHRYSLGIETHSGKHYLAIPVSNRMVDYREFFKIGADEYYVFRDNASLALEFAESCRRCEQDQRLYMQPGTDRGVPR